MRKFSGTNRAGANSDFAGKTCDAFAHFALFDSGFEFIPTDIQGMFTSTELVHQGLMTFFFCSRN